MSDVIDTTNDSNFSLVRLQGITFAERPLPGEEDSILFYNPRFVESFDAASMKSLLDSILEDGLQQPPIVRLMSDGTAQVIAGERRIRCLLKAYEENLLIFDDKAKVKKPAREVIEYIPCRIHRDCDDEKALRLAFTENAKHKPLSPREDIALAERLSKIYDTQEEICRVLGSNATWVSQTLSFREELPEQAFENLQEGLMSRYVAVQLLSYRKEDRNKIYEEMVEEERRQREDNRDEAEIEMEIADTEMEIAESEDEIRAEKTRIKAQKRRIRAEEKLKKIESEEGKLDQGHFEAATTNLSLTPRTPRMMNKNSIKKLISSSDELIDQVDEVVKEEYPSDRLRFAKILLNGIAMGNHDLKGMIRQHMFEEGLWDDPLEAEELDYAEND